MQWERLFGKRQRRRERIRSVAAILERFSLRAAVRRVILAGAHRLQAKRESSWPSMRLVPTRPIAGLQVRRAERMLNASRDSALMVTAAIAHVRGFAKHVLRPKKAVAAMARVDRLRAAPIRRTNATTAPVVVPASVRNTMVCPVQRRPSAYPGIASMECVAAEFARDPVKRVRPRKRVVDPMEDAAISLSERIPMTNAARVRAMVPVPARWRALVSNAQLAANARLVFALMAFVAAPRVRERVWLVRQPKRAAAQMVLAVPSSSIRTQTMNVPMAPATAREPALLEPMAFRALRAMIARPGSASTVFVAMLRAAAHAKRVPLRKRAADRMEPAATSRTIPIPIMNARMARAAVRARVN